MKEAMGVLGRPAGPSRSPLSAFSDEKKAKLKAILDTAGVRE